MRDHLTYIVSQVTATENVNKSGSSLLALAHLGGPGKRAIKRLRCSKKTTKIYLQLFLLPEW